MAKELFTPDWYPFFQRKFTSATQMFNAEEIGTYIVLLNYQWDNGGLPDDFSALCLLAKCTEPSIHKVIKKFEKKSDGLFWNKRLEEVRKEQLIRYEKRSNAGKAGVLAKKQSSSNAKAMNKQSPSIKKDNNINNKRVYIKEEEYRVILTPLPFSNNVKRALMEHFKNRVDTKKPVTERAANLLVKPIEGWIEKYGEQAVIEKIEYSVKGNYPNLYEPKPLVKQEPIVKTTPQRYL